MAGDTSNTTWSSWSLSTKLTVGVGIALAAVLVVFLYFPR
jgi:hypothetical protein